jgi:hypothetical protein
MLATLIRPAFTVAAPTLARVGLNVWGYTATAAGFVCMSTSIYMVGRKTTQLCEAGALYVTNKLHDASVKLEERLAKADAAEQLKKTARRATESDLKRRIEQEIARRISIGELLAASPPVNATTAAE